MTWIQEVNQDLIPVVDDAFDLGNDLAPSRFRSLFAGRVIGWGGSSTPTIPVTQPGAVIGMDAGGAGTRTMSFGGGGSYEPIMAAVKLYANNGSSLALAEHYGGGSVMMGSCYAGGSTGSATLRTASDVYGAFCGGYSYAQGTGASLIETQSGGDGSLMWVYCVSGNGNNSALANGRGAFVQGVIDGGTGGSHTLQANGSKGGFVQGCVDGNSGSSAIETITGCGAFAQGTAKTGGIIRASADGALAQGTTGLAGQILAGGIGALAKGHAGGNVITASAGGAVALGDATAGNITASAVNSAQLGPGTNAVADSLQVGGSFLAKANGQHGGANAPLTLGAAATTFAAISNMMTVTGDAGANTIATITGGISGQYLCLLFVDGLVTITDNGTGTADTVNLSAAFTSAANTVLLLQSNGTSWFEVSRSVN